MMESLFLKILNMSISASWLVLFVVALRFALKKAPKKLRCVLWAMVALRLLCPFSFESALSLIPSAETLPREVITGAPSFDIDSGIKVIDRSVNEYLGEHYYEGVSVPAGAGAKTMDMLGIVWLAGVAVMLLYAAVSYLRLRKKTAASLKTQGNVYLCDSIETPFILGIVKPRIYLPSAMEQTQMASVLAHEKAHLARRDHWWKPLGFALLAVYWFNPVIWLAYVLLCRDIELACDEKVIQNMEKSEIIAYSEALLSCSVPRRMIAACPLAFGEVGVKERIKSVLNYKKPAFWVIAAAVIACLAAAVCFLTNPQTKNYFELTETNSINGNHVQYALKLDKPAMSGQVSAEHWQNGRCVDSTAIDIDEATTELGIYLTPHRENNVMTGMDVQLDKSGESAAAIGYFPVSRVRDHIGWAFSAQEQGERVTVSSEREIILAALAYDFGSGVLSPSCEALAQEPERIAAAEEMIIVRVRWNAAPSESYASMDDYVIAKIGEIRERGVSYSVYENGAAAHAEVKDTVEDVRVLSLDRRGELAGLAAEGTLEVWELALEVKPTNAAKHEIVCAGGAYTTEDGYWYNGLSELLVVLRRESDQRCEILHQQTSPEHSGFFGYRESAGEALYDWYVTENHLGLPLYAEDWIDRIDIPEPGSLGNFPVHRYDGDGWYVYIPVQAWKQVTETNDECVWLSEYWTNSMLKVTRFTQPLADLETAAREQGYVSEMDGSGLWRRHENGEDSYYYHHELPDGGGWRVEIRWVEENITDYPYIAIEPQVLRLMAESFGAADSAAFGQIVIASDETDAANPPSDRLSPESPLTEEGRPAEQSVPDPAVQEPPLADGEIILGVNRGYMPSVFGYGSPENLSATVADDWSLEAMASAIQAALREYLRGSMLEDDLTAVEIAPSFVLPEQYGAGTALRVPYFAYYESEPVTLPSGADFTPGGKTNELTAQITLAGQGSIDLDDDFADAQERYRQLAACVQLEPLVFEVGTSEDMYEVVSSKVAEKLNASGIGKYYQIGGGWGGQHDTLAWLNSGFEGDYEFGVTFVPKAADSGYEQVSISGTVRYSVK